MRKVFYREHDAVLYQRYLKRKGIDSTIRCVYLWSEQRETYTVVPIVDAEEC